MPGALATAPSTPEPAPSDTRERILALAERLFAERGLDGTSVRDIAAAAHLTPGSLYNHFAGKDALYEAVLERGLAPLLALLHQITERPADASDAVIEAVMAHLAKHPHLPRLVHQEAARGGGRLTRGAGDAIRPLFEQGIAAVHNEPDSGWTADEAPLVIAAWLNLVFGHFALAPLMRELLPDDPLSPDGLARQTAFLRKLARAWMTTRER